MRRRFLLALCVLLSVVSVSSGQSNRIIVMLKNDSLCQPIAMRTMDAQVSDIPIALADVAERCGNVEIKRLRPYRADGGEALMRTAKPITAALRHVPPAHQWHGASCCGAGIIVNFANV